MRQALIGSALVFLICCSSNRNVSKSADTKSGDKLEIVKFETTADFYVFTAKDSNDKNQIILAEKGRVDNCYPFKKFIIRDSIKTTYKLKAGSTYDFVGAMEFNINGIKVKESGELAKIIWNCDSFSD